MRQAQLPASQFYGALPTVAGAINPFSRPASSLSMILGHHDKGLYPLGQIHDFSRPEVHLGDMLSKERRQ